jgi:group I intron endonuclease
MEGIYIIENILNKKCYIGSSTNVHKRLSNHKNLLLRKKHHSYKLQGSYNKRGIEDFDFRVIEYVYFPQEYDKKIRIEYLECLEEFYIKKYNSYKKGYNVSEIPRIVGNKNTKESLAKGVQTRRDNGSYVCSEETRKRRSEGLKSSEIFKKAHKIGCLKRRKSIYQYDLTGNFIREWDSYQTASKELNIFSSQILKNIHGTRCKCKSFIFSYEKHENVVSYRDRKSKLTRIYRNIETYDINNTLLKTYSNYKECAIDLKVKENTVLSAVIKDRRCCGYKLKYGESHR